MEKSPSPDVRFTTRFRIGIILLAINQPFGWGALLFCAALAVKTNRRDFYFWGIGAYASSWVILGLGLLLTGSEGMQYVRIWSSRIRNSFLRFFG